MSEKNLFGKEFESIKQNEALKPDQEYFDDLEERIISHEGKNKVRNLNPLIYGSAAAILLIALFILLPDGFLRENPDKVVAMNSEVIIENLDYYNINESAIVSYFLENQGAIRENELMHQELKESLGIESEDQIIEYLMEEDINLDNEL